jgi:hypothetical protein
MENYIIENILPSKSLSWIYRKLEESSVYPPAVTEIDGTYYQLNGFDIESKTFFRVDTESFSEALNKSVSLYGVSTLNTVELAGLVLICDKFEINTKEIEAFQFHGIKGKKNFETLLNVNRFCPVLKRYLSIKSIPLKTIAVFDKLEDDSRRYVKNSVDKKDMSVQDFRKLVNLLFDMKGRIDSSDFGDDLIKNLTEKKNTTKISFIKEFDRMKENFPMQINSPDMFETPRLNISFTVENAEELKDKLNQALEKSETIEDIYRFLDEQNIY